MRHAHSWHAFALALLLYMLNGAGSAFCDPATTLDAVKARGHVVCGVSNNTPGFSEVNARGEWRGFDVEFCSALAAAVFGDKTAVKFLSLTPNNRFKSLQDGEIDVLLRETSWTLTRDSELGARFTSIIYYDGQGFVIRRSHSIASVFELSGASICVLPGSSGQQAVADFFAPKEMPFKIVTMERWDDLVKAYLADDCTVLTGDMSLLAYERSRFPSPGEHMLLPELISKEPYGPAVRGGDDQWFSIVRWTSMALVDAEELGLTKSNVDAMKSSKIMDVRRFLGIESDVGAPLGLARDWAYKIVKEVGNYGEIFDRTLGEGSTLKLDRGLNRIWTKGGLMYAAPLR